ncbi:hypothetical protein Poli38472_000030 [Pythium oligandrum]|uniref:Uncharacterized protein n=1 Tax=Pythium oligandrum TaxID=41045 RepID=A0A8K1CBK5_PYTOL|nr:hypothetical protein Poli38472_000030 [Pythium oligandrum]|eukprot:TMW59988.1 hypothetical protein Poli38472_000030 [Pythium oligandrum]
MTSAKSVLPRVQELLDHVYSPFTGTSWIPRPFSGRNGRYLWSDAFGVCGYISLFYANNRDTKYLDQADHLIGAVHNDLGRSRQPPHARLGEATDDRPTLGGLRIGKEEEQDDGQYFHYLTKWMFALNRMSVARNDPVYNNWAVDLARVAHSKFVIRGLGGRPLRMIWKLSVDLQHATITSEGNLDPFDGLVTFLLLQRHSTDKSVLQDEIADMMRLVDRKLPTFATFDALDSGEALWLAQWFIDQPWSKELHRIALSSVDRLFRSGRFDFPAAYRLMFREMGTILGLKVAMPSIHDESGQWHARVDKVMAFWAANVYSRDEDITPLMYAAALHPGVWDPRGQVHP